MFAPADLPCQVDEAIENLGWCSFGEANVSRPIPPTQGMHNRCVPVTSFAVHALHALLPARRASKQAVGSPTSLSASKLAAWNERYLGLPRLKPEWSSAVMDSGPLAATLSL